MTTETETDCRTKSGVDVGLIDSIITTARVLRERQPDVTEQAIKEALLDLVHDEDFGWLLELAGKMQTDYLLSECFCEHSKIMHTTKDGSCGNSSCKCQKFEVASSNDG